MASVGVRVEPTVRLERAVEDFHGLPPLDFCIALQMPVDNWIYSAVGLKIISSWPPNPVKIAKCKNLNSDGNFINNRSVYVK